MNALDEVIEKGWTNEIPNGKLLAQATEELAELKADNARLQRVEQERDALFDIAVKATRAVDEMGFKTLKPKASALDHALANLPPELWERVDAAALKGES